MSKIWRVFVLVGIVLGIVGAAAPSVRAQGTKLPEVQPQDRILGKADAPITIFEYASLDCPHCADFDQNTLPKLKAEWIDTGKARLVFRDFPLYEDAVRAAMLARCAPPEQFFPFIDALFQSQTAWATAQNVDGELAKLARLSGMSDDQFKACMSNSTLENQVRASRLLGEQYGVKSTPTFFINGTKVEGALPISSFEKVLSEAAKS
jgi:protein-disulfide isomerase